MLFSNTQELVQSRGHPHGLLRPLRGSPAFVQDVPEGETSGRLARSAQGVIGDPSLRGIDEQELSVASPAVCQPHHKLRCGDGEQVRVRVVQLQVCIDVRIYY